MNSTNMSQICSLCGKDIEMGKKEKILYGHRVCKKCYYAFANRRRLAFFIDIIILDVLGLGILTQTSGVYNTKFNTTNGMLLSIGLCLILLIKDGFGGYSPGKALLDVQVINSISGKPISMWVSFKRNLPLLLPCAPIFIAFELGKGNRTGDGWVKTRVIWKKYKDKSPFAIEISNNIV
jgi:hypothetical protein